MLNCIPPLTSTVRHASVPFDRIPQLASTTNWSRVFTMWTHIIEFRRWWNGCFLFKTSEIIRPKNILPIFISFSMLSRVRLRNNYFRNLITFMMSDTFLLIVYLFMIFFFFSLNFYSAIFIRIFRETSIFFKLMTYQSKRSFFAFLIPISYVHRCESEFNKW